MVPTHRFYVPKEITQISATITGPEVHHMVKVLRKGKGAKVTLFDESSYEYLARIDSATKETVEVTILSKSRVDREPLVNATVCVAVPKGERMDQLIRSCSELGAKRIIPLVARRTAVKGGELGSNKLERWQRIAREASKQSGRLSVCDISPSQVLKDVLKEVGESEIALFGAPGDNNPSIADILEEKSKVSSVLLFVGPEGGFTRQERDDLEDAGVVGVGLGKPILRIETAAVAILSIAMYAVRPQN